MSRAYRLGYDACRHGSISFHCCPYGYGTLSYNDWRRGWQDCEAELYAC